MKQTISIPSLFLTAMIFITACNQNDGQSKKDSYKMKQPTLGTRSARIIETEGLQFKDLNRNNQLDRYEDWRLTPSERSKDLLGRMSLEQKAGLMLIADMRMYNEAFMQEAAGQTKNVTSDFNETDIAVDKNQFTGGPLPHPVMSAVGTTKGIVTHKMRHFIWRTTSAPADTMAIWATRFRH